MSAEIALAIPPLLELALRSITQSIRLCHRLRGMDAELEQLHTRINHAESRLKLWQAIYAESQDRVSSSLPPFDKIHFLDPPICLALLKQLRGRFEEINQFLQKTAERNDVGNEHMPTPSACEPNDAAKDVQALSIQHGDSITERVQNLARGLKRRVVFEVIGRDQMSQAEEAIVKIVGSLFDQLLLDRSEMRHLIRILEARTIQNSTCQSGNSSARSNTVGEEVPGSDQSTLARQRMCFPGSVALQMMEQEAEAHSARLQLSFNGGGRGLEITPSMRRERWDIRIKFTGADPEMLEEWEDVAENEWTGLLVGTLRYEDTMSQSQHEAVTIAKWRPVVLERRKIRREEGSPQEELQEMDLNRICQLFSGRKPDALRTLPCLGYQRGPREQQYFVVVYEFPLGCLASDPQTLSSMLTADMSMHVPLEERLAIAAKLGGTVWQLLAHRIFHKAIRSDNVVLFSGADTTDPVGLQAPISLQHSFLVGFEHARSSVDGAESLTEMAEKSEEQVWEKSLYRHPDFQNGSTRQQAGGSGYSERYELYSLGILLCEISAWRRVGDLEFINKKGKPGCHHSYGPAKLHNLLTAQSISHERSPLRDMAHRMGTKYLKAVLSCLRPPESVDVEWISNNVVRPLEESIFDRVGPREDVFR
jgi:hypothetical protein